MRLTPGLGPKSFELKTAEYFYSTVKKLERFITTKNKICTHKTRQLFSIVSVDVNGAITLLSMDKKNFF